MKYHLEHCVMYSLNHHQDMNCPGYASREFRRLTSPEINNICLLHVVILQLKK